MRQEARLVPGHAFFAQAFSMPDSHIENHCQVRTQHRRQFVHVAFVTDPGLHDPEILVSLSGQHGTGHADLVIVIHGVARCFAAY